MISIICILKASWCNKIFKRAQSWYYNII